jgi:hypothetical protein
MSPACMAQKTVTEISPRLAPTKTQIALPTAWALSRQRSASSWRTGFPGSGPE